MQTGKLLDVLAAHEKPISALAFSPSQAKPLLASASWFVFFLFFFLLCARLLTLSALVGTRQHCRDGTVRLWDIFTTGATPDVLRHNADVLAIAFRPDGKELATATLDGNIHFWETTTATYLGQIEGRNDISGGRTVNERRTAKNSAASKHFTSLCYSADGRLIMGGGRSKWVVMYEVSQRMRIKRYQLSRNRAIGGTVDFLDSRMLTEAGPMELIEDDDGDSDREAEGRKGRIDKTLPGMYIYIYICCSPRVRRELVQSADHTHTQVSRWASSPPRGRRRSRSDASPFASRRRVEAGRRRRRRVC